jgi:hypothetical protein
LESNEEEEGASRPIPKAQVVRITKVLRAHFRCAPIDLDKEMEDIEEINEIRTQLKT